jgi:muramoyltetrapeptide carboxypeptidase LdcA involved in peptidoglycan recycling
VSGGAHVGAIGGDDRTLDSTPPRRFARLRPGDRVALVAPSGPVNPARLTAGDAALRALGFDVVVGAHAADRVDLAQNAGPTAGHQVLAGTDVDRAADLRDAWCDPDVRAVVCARGGHGATRVLDHLDWDALAAVPAPKALHGSSDVTALHAAFGTRLGVTTTFGPMPAVSAERTADLRFLRDVLCGEASATTVTGTRALVPGHAEGPLAGGTLTLLAALVGTPYAPRPARDAVVLFEDVNEEPYRVDRMLTQLLQSGWLTGASGVVLGTWVGCGDPAELDALFTARLGPLGVPILAGVPVGHGPRQLTLELGAPVRLDTASLTLRTTPVPTAPARTTSGGPR